MLLILLEIPKIFVKKTPTKTMNALKRQYTEDISRLCHQQKQQIH